MKTLYNLKNQLRKLKSLFFIFSLALLPSTFYGQCTGTNVVENPQEFQWTYHPVTANNPMAYYSGTMEVGEVSLNLNNGETFTTRAYRQEGGSYSVPGPTIKVVPGNKYILSLHNTLPYEPLVAEHNVFKDPNAVNIHTHGLHISGESPGDDVTRVFEGGRGGDFVWDIPADHMGGTFWYHAHHHGSTYLQVSGGMFGLLVVDDSNDGIPATVSAMEEREILFGKLDPTAAGTGGDAIMGGSLSSMTWTTNGIVGGNICIPANTWQHWRVLVADADAMLRDIEFGPECEVKLLARDGVWRTVAPKDLLNNTIQITGASRADFSIRTSSDSWIKLGGNTIASITVGGTPDPSVHPYDTDGVSTWSAFRPSYLRDLRGETNVHTESMSMGARTVNGNKFDHMTPTLTLPTTQVQEWKLSGNVRHPFHLHVYHVQALADDRDFEAGEYYDVVASQMLVRFDLNQSTSSPYYGRTVMHCHILEHEDQGAMGWLQVDGGTAAPAFPADGDLAVPYSEYYIIGGGTVTIPSTPSSLSATTVSTTEIDLVWTDNSSDEDGFNIERSTDGTNFVFVGSVSANVVSYSDNGLTASTDYFYRVSAFNSAGSSSTTNVASATTLSDSGGGLLIYVEDITVTRQANGGGNRFAGVATVSVIDDSGFPVSGAAVAGDFSGPTIGSVSGLTDANGQVSFSTSMVKSPSGEWCFEVSDVSLTGNTYDAGANLVTSACESGFVAKKASFNGEEIVENSLGKDSNPFEFYSDLNVYPNPFQDKTSISFQLSESSDVLIEIYSLQGKCVAIIAKGNFDSGYHQLDWNTQNLENGAYLLKFHNQGHLIDTKRLMLIR